MFLADFHVHSTFSDGKMTIPEVVDLYGLRGFGAIAITDHVCEAESVVGKVSAYLGYSLTRANFPIYREIIKSEAERAWDQYQMVVIPGIELSKNSLFNHRSAHLLGLDVSEYISADGDIETLSTSLRSQGSLVIAAHPVWTRVKEKQSFHLWDHRQELKKYFDAWEIASGRYIFDEVKNSGLPILANSDLHRREQMESWKTVFHCEKKKEAILEAIQKQELGLFYYEDHFSDHVLNHTAAVLGNRDHSHDSRHLAYA